MIFFFKKIVINIINSKNSNKILYKEINNGKVFKISFSNIVVSLNLNLR